MKDLVGRRLGAYELTTCLRLSDHCQLYLSRDRTSGAEAALKVIPVGAADGDALVERFRRLAPAVVSLRHRHIVPLLAADIGEVDGERIAYLATAFIDGSSLEHELARLRAAGRTMPPAEAMAILSSLAGALDYAHHRGVRHLDLKPSNVLLVDGHQAVITDFGLAEALGAARLHGLDPDAAALYLAPELATEPAPDARADVYSLAAIASQLLLGGPPDTEGADDRGLSPAAAVIRRALDPAPERRYRSAGEMVAALQAALPDAAAGTPEEPDRALLTPPEPAPAEEPIPVPPKEGIRQFLVQILAVVTALMALLDKSLHAVSLMRNPLVGLAVVGVGLGAMLLSAGYVLARPGSFSKRQRILAAAGLAVTLVAAGGWGAWTVYDMTRPPKGLIVLISGFEQVPGSKSVDYSRRIEAGLSQALKELEVEGIYVERVSDVYTEADARGRAATHKATIVIYGWYDDAGVSPRFELVREPRQFAPIVKQTAVGLASLDRLEVRLDKELRELSYLATAAIGLAYYADGQDARALTFFDAALQSVPDETTIMGKEGILLYKASCHFSQFAFDKAVAALEEAVALNPDFFEARQNLAVAYSAYCNPDGALEQSQEALRLRPGDDAAHYLLGVLLSDDSRWDAAVAALQEAVRLDPDDAAKHSALAQALASLGRAEEADQEFAEARRLLTAAPASGEDEVSAIVELGDAQLNQGDVDGALATYSRAIERGKALGMRPDRLAWLYRSLGMGYWEAEDWSAMAAAYGQAISLAPGLYTDHVSCGLAYQHLGQMDQAQEHFEAAVRLQPCDANSHDLLGTVYLQRGETESALEQFQLAGESDPDDFTAWHAVGDILVEMDRIDEATAAYEKAVAGARAYLEKNPNDAGVTYMLGVVYYLLGQYDEARIAAERAVSLQPDADSRYLLASVLFELGDYEGAAQEFARGLELEPDRLAGLIGLARSYESLGDTEAAIEAYRRLLAVDDDFDHHLSLAALYEASGDFSGAAAEYQAALSVMEPDPEAEESLRLAQAGALSKVCRLDEALAVLESEGAPGESRSAPYLVTLAGLLESHGDEQRAADAYAALLRAYDDLAVTHYVVAYYQYRQDRLDEAVAEAQRSLELSPEFGFAWGALGQFLEAQGELEQAEEAYRTSLSHLADNSDAFLGLASIALQQDRPEDALRYAEQALEHVPGYSALVPDPAQAITVYSRIYLGLAHERLARQAEARADFAQAVDLAQQAVDSLPDYARATHQLGVALYAAGLPGDAEPYLQAAIACDATMAGARDRSLAHIDLLRSR